MYEIGTSNDYTYDVNGNMISDLNKGILEISYNHLNLPTNIIFDNGSGIEYIYNAAGVKLKKSVYDVVNNTVKHVDYLDGFQYAGSELQFFPTSEGYVAVTRGSKIGGFGNTSYVFNYVYNYTDHLGNIRLSYTKDPVSHEIKIMEENHYYPFGLKHSMYDNSNKHRYEMVDNMEGVARPTLVYKTDYQYKYNGKEFQDELGLGLYDYHARNYDPSLGRWNVIDPMAPKYLSHSPYAYALNNPIYFIDPDGMEVKADKNDPEKPHGRVILPGVTIVGSSSKTSKKSKSSNSSYFPGLSFTFSKIDLKSAFFGNHVDGAYRNMLSPQNKEGYLKMRQAMHEGQVGVVVLFSSVVALPYAVTYGSMAVSAVESSALVQSGQVAIGNIIRNQYTTEFVLKFGLDIGTQAIFKDGDLKLSDVTGAAAGALPFVPWYASGFVAEGTGLGTKALMGKEIGSSDYWAAGIKSFMISPLGTATGNAMEAVTNKIAGEALGAVHNSAQGAIIDDSLK